MSNYPPGVTGTEPQITGEPATDLLMELRVMVGGLPATIQVELNSEGAYRARTRLGIGPWSPWHEAAPIVGAPPVSEAPPYEQPGTAAGWAGPAPYDPAPEDNDPVEG